MYSCTYLEDASGVQRMLSFTARKRRLARCLMDVSCGDFLECLVVVVRVMVVPGWRGVAASTTTYFNCRQRQRPAVDLHERDQQTYFIIAQFSSSHVQSEQHAFAFLYCSSSCESLELADMHQTIGRYNCSFKHLVIAMCIVSSMHSHSFIAQAAATRLFCCMASHGLLS